MEYQINGIDGVFEEEKLALAVLQDYCSKNKCTFNELKVIFPDKVQGDKDYIKQKIGGNTGVFDTLAEAKDREDYFALLDPIKLKDATIVVSVAWGERNLPLFIEKAEAVGYTISTVDSEKGSSSDTKHYTFIKAFNNENSDQDYKICDSIVAQTNGKYTLSFHLDNDGDGVIDTYQFYDIKTKVSALNSSPWDFTEFTDVDEEWTEHESLGDFGFDSTEIGETLENMSSKFVEKYLNEESQTNFADNAAVPFSKRDIFNEESSSGILVFEEGDKSILPK